MAGERTVELTRRWLLLVGVVHVAIGVAMPWLLATAFGEQYLAHLWTAFYDGHAPDATTQGLVRWLLALLGAMIAGWGVLIGGLAHVAATRRVRAPIDVLLLALMLWVALDMGWGWSAGVRVHVLVDALALLALVPPLLLLRARLPRRPGGLSWSRSR